MNSIAGVAIAVALVPPLAVTGIGIAMGPNVVPGIGVSLGHETGGGIAAGAFTLFATHYFELTALAQELRGCGNVHLDATEHEGQLVFLHAVKPGPANQSYGLQVAALAGVPEHVVRRARRYLATLESQQLESSHSPQAQLPLGPASDDEDDALRDALAWMDTKRSPRASFAIEVRDSSVDQVAPSSSVSGAGWVSSE